MSFCTVINCMDGRTQLPVIEYLKQRCNAEYVDSITEPGPIKILAEAKDQVLLDSIHARLEISVRHHGSNVIAVVAHYDCTGNPVPRDQQERQLAKALDWVRQRYPDLAVIGLWVNDAWQVEEIA